MQHLGGICRIRRNDGLAAAQDFAVISADLGEIASTVGGQQLDFVHQSLTAAFKFGVNHFRAHFFFGGFYRLAQGHGSVARHVFFVLAFALDDLTVRGIDAEFVFLLVVAQVDVINGTAPFHFQLDVIGACTAFFLGDGHGLSGADFALLQGLEQFTVRTVRAGATVSAMVVIVFGGSHTAGEQHGEAERGKDGFFHIRSPGV